MSPILIQVQIGLSPELAALIKQLLAYPALTKPTADAGATVVDLPKERREAFGPDRLSAKRPPLEPTPRVEPDPGSDQPNAPAQAPTTRSTAKPPAAPTSARTRGDWITPERDALLLNPGALSIAELHTLCLDLPGPPMTDKAISMRRWQLRHKAKASTHQDAPDTALPSAPAPEAPCPPARSPTPLAKLPSQPLEIDFNTAWSWASQRGLAHVRDGMDIDAVNRKRTELGLAPFVVKARNRANGAGSPDA